ncbi:MULTISPECIES: amidohydrolase family protein [unclassified Halobacteriovorax]|uniref:metal-dependent hydrolase family protein n=1 Tax=unclassified Halobacteriovorax TaxID=2639665 RepID=UPI00399A14B7
MNRITLGLLLFFGQSLIYASSSVLFEGVKVFNGTSTKLSGTTNVLIENNKIKRIGRNVKASADATVISGKGRVLMPGMIDNHWHSTLATMPQAQLLSADLQYISINAVKTNEDTLLRGFTSVRDVGGNVFGLKKATDNGMVKGPRIYPSGPYLSQTSGHGDFRPATVVPTSNNQDLDYFQRVGMTIIADGVPQVRKGAREAFRMGASQLKVMAGGGVSSLYDPLDVTQYSYDEMKAIVEEANNWNTYVTVHAFSDKAIEQAINAGVKSVEHGFLLSDKTLKKMAKKGVWLSIQPILNDEDAIPFPDPVSQAKFVEVTNGTDKVMRAAKKHRVKIAWGTDTLFDPALAAKQGKMAAKMKRWFKPHEVLRILTHDNAQLLKLSGKRDPYPDGELGVVRVGAYADLILVNGDPLKNIDLIATPETSFAVIMKNGEIIKNMLEDRNTRSRASVVEK